MTAILYIPGKGGGVGKSGSLRLCMKNVTFMTKVRIKSAVCS